MKIIRNLAAACCVWALASAAPALATTQWPTTTAGESSVGSVMFGCENGSGQWVPATTAGQCGGSSGGSSTPFTPSNVFGTLTATASPSASTALPTSTGTVEFANLTSAYVSCTFASGAATGVVNNVILPPMSVKDIGVTGFDHVSCIDQTGSTGSNQILMAGGSGNGTGFGGGSSGTGGGAITAAVGSYAAGALSAGAFATGAGVDGWDLTQGAKADAAYGGSGSASVIALLKGVYAALGTLNTTAGNPLATQAISNIIGGVGLNATPSLVNGNGVVPTQGGTALSATNPAFETQIPGTLALGQTFVSGTVSAAMTGTSSTQVVAAVASKRLYITRVKCNNSSTTVNTLVQIQDGSGGTVLDTLVAADNFGGEQGTNAYPLFWTTAGNGLYAQDVTTGASVICSASGYSG